MSYVTYIETLKSTNFLLNYLIITEILIKISSSTVVDVVVGAVVTLVIIFAFVIGIVFCKRKKGMRLYKS